MFSGLRENAPIFILTKGERPVLQVGTVISVSNPNIGFGAQMPMLNPGSIMEVTVKVGDHTFDHSSMLIFKVFPKRRGRVIKVVLSHLSHHSLINKVLSI